jgi:tetratricopeptide (TPR) repeat protein
LLVQLKREPEAQTELETAASFPPEDPEIKIALSQLYSRMGESGKSKTIMASSTGGVISNEDFFGPVLNDDVDPSQAEHDAMKNLGNIGDQFESGEYDQLNPADFSAMDSVALSWARLGWAYFLEGNTLQASQYLEAAWSLSLSGTVANRLGRVYEKTGARDHARHLYALAFAAGGPDALASRDRITKLGSLNVQKELALATAELDKLHTMRLPAMSTGTASARFEMLFDNSTTPDRVRFIDGDESLRDAGEKLQKLEYLVRFPDISSIKIIRLGTVICRNSACNFELERLGAMQHRTNSEVATAPGKK